MRLLTFVILINALMIGQIGGADLGNSEWQRIKTRPHPPRRIEPTMITVGDRLYLIGGADFQKRRFFDDIWRWVDPDTRQRSETLSANQQACNACTWEPEGRTDRSVWLQGPAFESISALIYFHGGITETDRLEDGVFAYNTNTGGVIDVTQKGKRPVPRSGHKGAAIDGKLYFIGGNTANGPTDQVWQFDPKRGKWKEKKPFPLGTLTDHALVAVDNKIYVIGVA